jgi:glycosyltransferase involved in cell wall biosynthesis
VSIVVGTYNAGPFAASAIDSALAQDHPACDVVVVDDASTDGTPELVRSYGERVRAILRPSNGGQAVAYAQAWPQTRGRIVIFLDGDDLLEPHAASTIARCWRPGLAKLQYQITTIDEAGRTVHGPAPAWPPGLDAPRMRALLLVRGSYPSVPACGNAYAREFLERRGPPATALPWWDLGLEVDAPFFGAVDSLSEPLARKRVHAGAGSLTASLGPERFERLHALFEGQLAYLEARARQLGLPVDLDAIRRRSAWHQELELVLARLGRRPGHTASGRLPAAVMATLGTLEPARKKLLLILWQAAVAIGPRALADRALAWRFLPASRPGLLRGADEVTPARSLAGAHASGDR